MKHIWSCVCVAMAAGCAAQIPVSVRPVAPPPAPAEAHAEDETRVNAGVQVGGLEGTLSNYDVRTALEERGAEFSACHELRARALPVLSGEIEFAIEVDIDGQVRRVDVRASTLGDRALERCLSDVVRSTRFHRPNGGIATVTWFLALEPGRADHTPDVWDAGRIARVIDNNMDELQGSCDLTGSSGTLTATMYVGSSGRIVAAGVASAEGSTDERLDCVADTLRSWTLPTPQGRFAKVSFVLPTP